MKRAALILLPLAAGCSSDPLRFIPANERQVLQAEARLAGGNAPQQPGARISVEQLLAQARQERSGTAETPAAPASDATPAPGATPVAAPLPPTAPAQGNRLSVESLLAQARQAPAEAPQPEGPRLLLRFSGDETQPTEAQRNQVTAFTRRARGRNLIVSARSGGDLLGPRRAMAVARLVQSRFPDVELRFDAAMPGDEVSLEVSRAPPEPNR